MQEARFAASKTRGQRRRRCDTSISSALKAQHRLTQTHFCFVSAADSNRMPQRRPQRAHCFSYPLHRVPIHLAALTPSPCLGASTQSLQRLSDALLACLPSPLLALLAARPLLRFDDKITSICLAVNACYDKITARDEENGDGGDPAKARA